MRIEEGESIKKQHSAIYDIDKDVILSDSIFWADDEAKEYGIYERAEDEAPDEIKFKVDEHGKHIKRTIKSNIKIINIWNPKNLPLLNRLRPGQFDYVGEGSDANKCVKHLKGRLENCKKAVDHINSVSCDVTVASFSFQGDHEITLGLLNAEKADIESMIKYYQEEFETY